MLPRKIKKNLIKKKSEENFCLYEAHYWPVKRGFLGLLIIKFPGSQSAKSAQN